MAHQKLSLVPGRICIVLVGFKLLVCRCSTLYCLSHHLGNEQMEGELNGFTSAYSTVTITKMLGVANQFSITPVSDLPGSRSCDITTLQIIS